MLKREFSMGECKHTFCDSVLSTQSTRFALGINLFAFIFNEATVPFAHQTNRKTILSPFLLYSIRWIRYDGKLYDIDEQWNYCANHGKNEKDLKEKDETFYRESLEKLSIHNTNTKSEKYPKNPANSNFSFCFSY